MEHRFTKLHGTGNDFIFFDDLFQSLSLSSSQVSWLCDRHFGIGADGIILVRPSSNPTCIAFMHYINSDGSLAEMCGNGIRCFAKHLVDSGLVPPDQEQFSVDTLAGGKTISVTRNAEGKAEMVTVDMGPAQIEPSEIPTTLASNATTKDGISWVKEAELDSPWGPFSFTCVSMGNPHAVCFLDDIEALPDEAFLGQTKSLASLDLDRIGSFFCKHEVFPQQANIEFATIEKDLITMRVYERGVGETLACGTGACATAYAAYLTGRNALSSTVSLPGGTLTIEITNGKFVIMTGPATEVFRGVINLEN